MKRTLLTLMILLPAALFGQLAKKYSNEFLAIGANPRAFAMSNTVAASVNDFSSVYYNPAGLGVLQNNIQLGFMHSEYFGGLTSYDFGGVAFKVNQNGAIGIGLARFGADNIPNTFELIDQNGLVDYSRVKEFSVADYGFFLSYGQKQNFGRKRYQKLPLRYGGTLKVIHRQVGSFATSWGFGLDGGVQYNIDQKSIIGISVRDLTRTVNLWSFSFTEQEKQVLAKEGNEIPKKSTEVTNPRVVASINRLWTRNKDWTLLAEGGLDLTTDGRRNVLFGTDPFSLDPHFGFEGGYKKMFFLRLGLGGFQFYKSDNPQKPDKKVFAMQPSIGAGLQFKRIAFDYAFTDLGNLNVGLYSHVLGVKVGIDKKKK